MSQHVPPWVGAVWYSLCFLDLGDSFLSLVRGVFSCHLFSGPFSLFSFWDPYNAKLLGLTLSQRFLKLSSFLFCLFFFILFHGSDFQYSFSSLIHSPASFILMLIPSSLFFISVIVFFNYLWLFFIFSNYLLKTYCNFLRYAWILFPGSWIIFMIITLNSLLGRLPISMSLSFYGVLSCSFIWNIILCHLLLSKIPFVFLRMWKVSYVSQHWRRGLL